MLGNKMYYFDEVTFPTNMIKEESCVDIIAF